MCHVPLPWRLKPSRQGRSSFLARISILRKHARSFSLEVLGRLRLQNFLEVRKSCQHLQRTRIFGHPIFSGLRGQKNDGKKWRKVQRRSIYSQADRNSNKSSKERCYQGVPNAKFEDQEGMNTFGRTRVTVSLNFLNFGGKVPS